MCGGLWRRKDAPVPRGPITEQEVHAHLEEILPIVDVAVACEEEGCRGGATRLGRGDHETSRLALGVMVHPAKRPPGPSQRSKFGTRTAGIVAVFALVSGYVIGHHSGGASSGGAFFAGMFSSPRRSKVTTPTHARSGFNHPSSGCNAGRRRRRALAWVRGVAGHGRPRHGGSTAALFLFRALGSTAVQPPLARVARARSANASATSHTRIHAYIIAHGVCSGHTQNRLRR